MKKHSFIKLICLIMCFVLLLPTVVQAATIQEDITKHWAYDTMSHWSAEGLFEKIPQKEFGTDKSITRGAFVHIFNTMLGVTADNKKENPFTDVSADAWNYEDILTAYSVGYINGYPDKTFKADKTITREEMCTIISKYYELDKVYDNTKLNSFKDKSKIQEYATNHVGALAELAIVQGYPGGNFKPQNNITYAEAATIITRFLGYINGGNGVSGRIYSDGKPVYNAAITVYKAGTTTIAASGHSDVYGDYIIDVPAGTYDITVKKNDLSGELKNIIVKGDVRTYNKIILTDPQTTTGTHSKPIEPGKPDDDFDYSKLPYREPKTMAELVELNGGEQPVIHVNEDNSIRFYSGIISNNAVDCVEDVIAELNVVKDIFNFNDSRDEFVLEEEVVNGFSLSQVYNEIPVLDSGLLVGYNDDGYIDNILSYYQSSVNYSSLNTVPTIKSSEIEPIINKHYKEEYESIEVSEPSLGVYVNGASVNLVWCVWVNGGECIYIDAHSGVVLKEYRSEVQAADYKIDDIDSYSLELNSDTIDISTYETVFGDVYQMHNIAYDIRIHDLKNKTLQSSTQYDSTGKVRDDWIYSDSNQKLLVDTGKMNIVTSDYDNWDANNTAYQDGFLAIRMFSDILQAWDDNTDFKKNKDLPIRVFVNVGYDNACYWGTPKFIRFLFGNTDDYLSMLDVVGHEFGHYIQDQENKGNSLATGLGAGKTTWTEMQAGAISEGTADIFGMLAEAIASPTSDKKGINDTAFWYIADNFNFSDANGDGKDDDGVIHIRDHSGGKADFYGKNNRCYTDAIAFKTSFDTNGNRDFYTGSYLIVNILKYMINNDETLTAPVLLEFWRKTIEGLDTTATFDELASALLSAAKRDDVFKKKQQLVVDAYLSVGIGAKNGIPTEQWYTEAMEDITALIDLSAYKDTSTGTYKPNVNISQSDYVRSVVDFCNKAGASISLEFKGSTAKITNSSNQSISLIVESSKDILRWEAYVIAARIMNFCASDINKEKYIRLWDYAYQDYSSDNKHAGHSSSCESNGSHPNNYKTFVSLLEKQLEPSGKSLEDVFPTKIGADNKAITSKELIRRYYPEEEFRSYQGFSQSHRVIKTAANTIVSYDDEYGDVDSLSNTSRMIMDSLYNIYMSQGKTATFLTAGDKVIANSLTDKMTLASVCFFLHSFMK